MKPKALSICDLRFLIDDFLFVNCDVICYWSRIACVVLQKGQQPSDSELVNTIEKTKIYEQPVTISNREWRLVALSANANLKGSASADNSTAVSNSAHSMKIQSIQVKNATTERSELVNTIEKTTIMNNRTQ